MKKGGGEFGDTSSSTSPTNTHNESNNSFPNTTLYNPFCPPNYGPSPSFPSSSNVDPKPNSFSPFNVDSNPNSFTFGSTFSNTLRGHPLNPFTSPLDEPKPNNFSFWPTTTIPSSSNVDPKPNSFNFRPTFPNTASPFNSFNLVPNPNNFSYGSIFSSPFNADLVPNVFSFGPTFTLGRPGTPQFQVCQKCGHNSMWESQGKAYSPTPVNEPHNPFLRFQSISAMPFHQHKSHEQLRWEHYQPQPQGNNNKNGSAKVNAFTMGQPGSSLVQLINGPALAIPLQNISYFPHFP